ncbi:hypothetical protein NF552_24815 (plasmid) [Roseomonas mucosa]|nr:hypothetical protein NF552_24815 [Roseomonas mucosa]
MDLAEAEPVWIDPGNENAVQLDLTGSRLPPQALEARTLDGITSVTRQSTYLGMRAWIVKRYYEAKQPDRYANFLAFAARQEAALAIGLVADNFDGLNLIGARGAKRAVDEGGSKMQLSALAKQKAVSIYGASFNTLGLGGQRDSGVPNLSEAGHELANAVETRVSASRYARKLAGDPQISSVATKDLIEFAGQMGFAGASGKERQLLFRILFGLDGKASYLPRRDTYAMLLLQQQNDPGSGDPEFLRAVVASGHFGDCLSKTVDDWAEYATLDLISRCHETGLAAVVAVLHSLRGENSRGRCRNSCLSGRSRTNPSRICFPISGFRDPTPRWRSCATPFRTPAASHQCAAASGGGRRAGPRRTSSRRWTTTAGREAPVPCWHGAVPPSGSPILGSVGLIAEACGR